MNDPAATRLAVSAVLVSVVALVASGVAVSAGAGRAPLVARSSILLSVVLVTAVVLRSRGDRGSHRSGGGRRARHRARTGLSIVVPRAGPSIAPGRPLPVDGRPTPERTVTEVRGTDDADAVDRRPDRVRLEVLVGHAVPDRPDRRWGAVTADVTRVVAVVGAGVLPRAVFRAVVTDLLDRCDARLFEVRAVGDAVVARHPAAARPPSAVAGARTTAPAGVAVAVVHRRGPRGCTPAGAVLLVPSADAVPPGAATVLTVTAAGCAVAPGGAVSPRHLAAAGVPALVPVLPPRPALEPPTVRQDGPTRRVRSPRGPGRRAVRDRAPPESWSR
jgi:hypothetical protein